MSNKDSKFLKGAFTLTLSGLLVKIIGAIYRIPLYAILGSEGMGLFQMAYPIYAILLTVSSAGLNVAISKVVAERWALKRWGGARASFRVSMGLMVVFGLLASLTLYSLSGWIALNMAKDPRAKISIMAISPALFVVSVLSAFRGWFQGIEEMEAPAISQVLEQIGRLLTMFILARMLLPRGIEYAASGATFGAVVGALVGVLYIGSVYVFKSKNWTKCDGEEEESVLSSAKEIISIAVPVSLASAVFGITELLDLGLVPGRLQAGGILPHEATRLYGQLSAGAFPLLNLPTIFTGALQVALVPSISSAIVLKDRESVARRVKKALSITIALALPAALGLYVLSDPIPMLLYNDPGVSRVLRPIAPAVFFLALQQVTSGILQGLGKLKVPLINLLWAALVKAILTYTLVSIPSINIVGAAIATSFHFGVAAMLNLWAIQREVGSTIDLVDLLKVSFAGAIMSIVAASAYAGVASVLWWKAATVLAIGVAALFYGILVLLLRVISIDDLSDLPLIGNVLQSIMSNKKRRK